MIANISGGGGISVSVGSGSGLKSNVVRKATITVKPSPSASFTQAAPITIKNVVGSAPINSLEDISDVDEINVTNYATVVYNQTNDKYEVKMLPAEGLPDIDGGTF